MPKTGSFYALVPLIFFIIVYLGSSVLAADFYSVPVLVIFMLALFIAFLQFRKVPFDTKLDAFARGAGDVNIMIMIIIFLLAGAFGEISRQAGAVDAAVNMALQFIPSNMIFAALFVVASFISLSLGTSVGTIAVLAPVALGISSQLPGSTAIALSAVVGGSMFGDNLSFISDTTIAATRTQGIGMREKFRTNIKIVWLPAIITALIYIYLNSWFPEARTSVQNFNFWKVIPYLLVFILSLSGINVIWTLMAGIAVSLGMGFYFADFNVTGAIQHLGKGMSSMFELSLVCILIGGIVGIIKQNGGIDYLLYHITRRIKSTRGAEYSIAALTALVNLCIANNTITIIIVGPVAKEISDTNDIEPSRTASILDTVSCFMQGLIPYGAQVLTAVSIASFAVSPVDILKYLYYPLLIGLSTFVFIGISGRKGRIKA